MLHPPGVPILAAGIHKTMRRQVDLPLEIMGALLDTCAAGLLYWLVANFFHHRVALAAGLLYSLFPPLAAEATLGRSPDGLLSVFVVATLCCVVQAGRWRRCKRVMWWFGAGTLTGLGAYLRPDYLLMPMAIGIAWWIYHQRFWQGIAAAIAIEMAAILLLIPWAYRNHQWCGHWIVTSTSVGATLITGLGEYHNVWGFGGRDEDRHQQAVGSGIESPWSPEADAYFRSLFWESVKAHPIGYVVTVIKRIPMTLFAPQSCGYDNPWKTTRFEDEMALGRDRFAVIRERPGYVAAAYWEYILMGVANLLMLVSSIYMMVRERRRLGVVVLLLCPHLYSIGTHMLTHMEPRFLLPSQFCFIIGLAYVLGRGWKDAPADEQSLAE